MQVTPLHVPALARVHLPGSSTRLGAGVSRVLRTSPAGGQRSMVTGVPGFQMPGEKSAGVRRVQYFSLVAADHLLNFLDRPDLLLSLLHIKQSPCS